MEYIELERLHDDEYGTMKTDQEDFRDYLLYLKETKEDYLGIYDSDSDIREAEEEYVNRDGYWDSDDIIGGKC